MADSLGAVISENRYPNEKTPALRLVKSMTEDGVNMSRWNDDTLTRYIAVGTKLKADSVKSKLMLWESFECRGCLIDNLMVMRSVVSVCPADDDLEFVLQILFLEQRAGLRADVVPHTKSHNESRTPTNRVKAILLRRCLLIHLGQQFPQFTSLVATYDTDVFVKTVYNIDADGTRPIQHDVPQSDVSDADDDDADLGLTSHASRPPLQRLCHDPVTNKLERTLCAMFKESVSSKATIDLTVSAAKPLVARIEQIGSLLDSHH